MPDSVPDEQPRDGRERLKEAFRRPGRGQVVVAVLLAAVGFGAVTQVNANENNDTYAGYRQQDLIDALSGLAGASERARSEIERLEQSRADLLDRTERRRAALEQAQQEADDLTVLAGLVPVSGPGLTIRLADEGTVSINSMLDLVQELRSAGAEAIEIDGQVRLVVSSAFEATEEGLVVDGVLLEAPYVVDVIGEPSALRGAISFPGGPEDSVEDDGATIAVEQPETVEVETVVTESDAAPDLAEPVE
ncbi:DUF881 domain-containing protein [uncultured Nocardioides sp.]|uniref:DUF881 domain-containing protein n=1 Tax=uncultured Nocardioides sp. TaxID=198441 RepID=UPI002628FC59|nr:DUF881 domain-containing protein [uncultured Nocardioides sp.]